MEIVVKKWGNSLGVIIPRGIAKDLDLKDGSSVDISEDNDRIIISPKKKTRLDDLLGDITPSNIHDESDFGNPIGKESW